MSAQQQNCPVWWRCVVSRLCIFARLSPLTFPPSFDLARLSANVAQFEILNLSKHRKLNKKKRLNIVVSSCDTSRSVLSYFLFCLWKCPSTKRIKFSDGFNISSRRKNNWQSTYLKYLQVCQQQTSNTPESWDKPLQ